MVVGIPRWLILVRSEGWDFLGGSECAYRSTVVDIIINLRCHLGGSLTQQVMNLYVSPLEASSQKPFLRYQLGSYTECTSQ